MHSKQFVQVVKGRKFEFFTENKCLVDGHGRTGISELSKHLPLMPPISQHDAYSPPGLCRVLRSCWPSGGAARDPKSLALEGKT